MICNAALWVLDAVRVGVTEDIEHLVAANYILDMNPSNQTTQDLLKQATCCTV